MIRLPNTPRNRRTLRILTMTAGVWGVTTQPWFALPMPAIFDRLSGALIGGVERGGYHVQSISRWCLPDEERAQFYIDTGLINGQMVVAQDLANTWVRIQVQDSESFPNGDLTTLLNSGWKTVFVGYVLYQSAEQNVGERPHGRMVYYCAGALSRTRMWPLDRHATSVRTHNKGNPGYNVPLHGWFRRVLGNKGTAQAATDPYGDLTGAYAGLRAYYWQHALPLDASDTAKWTDEDVVKHALVSSRASGEPLIEVDLADGLFTGTYSWPVSAGDSCFDLLRKVCNRQRGRGSVFLAYADADDNLGNVTLTLSASPSNSDEIIYYTTATAGAQDLLNPTVIPAATHGLGGTAIDVDLVGDHRLTRPLQYDNRISSVYDAIVVQGECLQVLCNLNFFGGTLDRRWSATDETAFDAIAATAVYKLTSARWRHVWRRYGFDPSIDYMVKAEPGSAAESINYVCDNLGGIAVVDPDPSVTGDSGTSQMTLRFLNDLPIYEGWSYAATTPARWDGAIDYLPPARMPVRVMYRGDTDVLGNAAWYPLDQIGFNIQTDDFGFLIVGPNEDQFGYRMLASSGAAANKYRSINVPGITTVSGIDQNKLNTIVGVELGSRVQIVKHKGVEQTANVDYYNASGRRLLMTVNGVHLWLGAPGAIWELDWSRATMANYPPGLTFPGALPYVIRDDRNQLSFIAGLTWEYWGHVHNPGTWALADCGLMSGFDTQDNGFLAYPTLGNLVGTVRHANGDDGLAALNTCVSSIHYDHEVGETTWRTDYIQYEGNVQ